MANVPPAADVQVRGASVLGLMTGVVVVSPDEHAGTVRVELVEVGRQRTRWYDANACATVRRSIVGAVFTAPSVLAVAVAVTASTS